MTTKHTSQVLAAAARRTGRKKKAAKRAPRKDRTAIVNVDLRIQKADVAFIEEVAASACVDLNTVVAVMLAIAVANERRRMGAPHEANPAST